MIETRYYENDTIARNESQTISLRLNAVKQSQAAILTRIQSGALVVKQKPDNLKMLIETAKVTTTGNKLVIVYNQPKNEDFFDD